MLDAGCWILEGKDEADAPPATSNQQPASRNPRSGVQRLMAAGPGPVLVSACLLGFSCRYDGCILQPDSQLPAIIREYFTLIPVCPEQMGGLPTPRVPSEIISGNGYDVLQGASRLCNLEGRNVTESFLRGAREAILVARICGCRTAIMKERSPSCGVHHVVKNGETVSGPGVSTAALLKAGVAVFSSDDVALWERRPLT